MQLRVFWVAAACVVILATGLRVGEIALWSLNNDEIAEVRWSSWSFHDMMDAVRFDAVHPPLDYLEQYVISHLHEREWVHRLPSVLFGSATVAVVILLGNLWFSRTAGLVAGFFLAIAPTHIRYSQEVRPYAMGVFFLCASLAALELFARQRQRRWAVAWFVLVYLAAMTLYFAGMLAGATSLFRILIARRDELNALWRRLPLIVVGWILLYAPWLAVVLQLAHKTPAARPETLNKIWWVFRAQTFGTGDLHYEAVSAGSWALWICAGIGVWLMSRYQSLETPVFWFAAGTALEVIALQIHPHYSTPRYLMPSWPGAIILAGAGVAWLVEHPRARAFGIAAVFLFAAHAALTLQTYYRGDRTDWRAVARYVHDRARGDEPVIIANNWVERNFNWYFGRLEPRPDLHVIRFAASDESWKGPAWFVTGGCFPRAGLNSRNLMAYWPSTDEARAYYIRRGDTLPMKDELCPE